MKLLLRIWNDPVWSKVISVGILAVLGLVFSRYNTLINMLKENAVPIILSLTTLSVILMFRLRDYSASVHQKPSQEAKEPLVAPRSSMVIAPVATTVPVKIVTSPVEASPVARINTPSESIRCVRDVRTLAIGDYVELTTEYGKLRITLKEIGSIEAKEFRRAGEVVDAVKIDIDLGGALIYGGEETRRSQPNEYFVPAKTRSAEVPYSLFCFFSYEDHFSFLRLFVKHLNRFNNTVEIHVLSFAGSNLNKPRTG